MNRAWLSVFGHLTTLRGSQSMLKFIHFRFERELLSRVLLQLDAPAVASVHVQGL